jgi:hypothetical protein
MRNALVARDGDFRLDPQRAFYPKVIHVLGKGR